MALPELEAVRFVQERRVDFVISVFVLLHESLVLMFLTDFVPRTPKGEPNSQNGTVPTAPFATTFYAQQRNAAQKNA